MEKLPLGERPKIKVFGKAPEEEKQKASEDYAKRFREGGLGDFTDEQIEKIRRVEYDKNAYERRAIEASNELLNEILSQLGLEAFDVPEKNIHLIPPEVYQKICNSKSNSVTASWNPKRQGIVANIDYMRLSRVNESYTLFHELTHAKAFTSLDIAMREGKTRIGIRRGGMDIEEGFKKSDAREFYQSFRGLDEAIVATLEKRYGGKVIEICNDPETNEELKWLQSEEGRAAIEKRAKEENNYPPEDILWVSKNWKEWITYGYEAQRKVLNYLCEEIGGDTKEQPDTILNEFIKAHFTGNIITIAKLVEKSFGSGSFRTLGTMDDNKDSARRVMDLLRKMRIRQKRNKE